MLMLLAAIVVSAAPTKWVTVDEAVFSAQFPQVPVSGVLPDDPGTTIYQAAVTQPDGRKWETWLSVTSPPEDVRSKARELSAEQLRQVQMDLLVPEEFSLLTEAEITLIISGKPLPARDFTARHTDGRKMSGRVLTYKGRLFQLITFHTVKKPLDAEHARFVGSVQFK
ncbi:MAG: hypothetical protein K1X64_08380 [Myxococcaceae bacterium]|nr:hypothetical protein [Myxococcaceae bacterium]